MNAHLSWDLARDLDQLLAFHFMDNALWAGTIVAVAAGLVGWMMVLRRQSFVGHTLAVVGFPGASGAVWLGLPAVAGYFCSCVAAAVVIAGVADRSRAPGSPDSSAVVGTVQAFALASGFLFASLYGGFLNGTTGMLFGSFLGVTDAQVRVLAAVGAAAVGIVAVIGRPLLFASIDPDVAGARGVPVRALSSAFVILLGVAAAETSQITGTLLVFALLVMPAAAAQRLTCRPLLSLGLTVALGVGVTWLGLGVAYFSAYPVGFYVTTFGFVAYLLAAAAGRSSGRPGPAAAAAGSGAGSGSTAAVAG